MLNPKPFKAVNLNSLRMKVNIMKVFLFDGVNQNRLILLKHVHADLFAEFSHNIDNIVMDVNESDVVLTIFVILYDDCAYGLGYIRSQFSYQNRVFTQRIHDKLVRFSIYHL